MMAMDALQACVTSFLVLRMRCDGLPRSVDISESLVAPATWTGTVTVLTESELNGLFATIAVVPLRHAIGRVDPSFAITAERNANGPSEVTSC